MTSWWKAITKNTHNADWVNDLASVENSVGGEDTADVDAEDLIDYEFVLSKVIYFLKGIDNKTVRRIGNFNLFTLTCLIIVQQILFFCGKNLTYAG